MDFSRPHVDFSMYFRSLWWTFYLGDKHELAKCDAVLKLTAPVDTFILFIADEENTIWIRLTTITAQFNHYYGAAWHIARPLSETIAVK